MSHFPLFARVAILALILEALGALSLGAGLLGLNQSRENQTAIIKLNAALDRQEAIAKQQADIGQRFLREIDYVCSITSFRAAESHLPPPPSGICNVAGH